MAISEQQICGTDNFEVSEFLLGGTETAEEASLLNWDLSDGLFEKPTFAEVAMPPNQTLQVPNAATGNSTKMLTDFGVDVSHFGNQTFSVADFDCETPLQAFPNPSIKQGSLNMTTSQSNSSSSPLPYSDPSHPPKPLITKESLNNRRHAHISPNHHCPRANCTRSYTRFAELRRHLRSHDGLRPYVCGISGCKRAAPNGFARKDHLRQHLRNVHGVLD